MSCRVCGDDERDDILEIINAAAGAYRGVIPADRWHEPYMGAGELEREIEAGVCFWGSYAEDRLIGVMGVQQVRDVDLIRHAYVRPDAQRRGVGAALLRHLSARSSRQMLVGTWAGADWAISFYRRHGFEVVAAERTTDLLQTYWTIPAGQVEASLVLANPPLDDERRVS